MAKFCQTFRLYIEAGKVVESIEIPYQVVMGYLSDFLDTHFYDTTLCLFIDNNIPKEEDRGGRKTEDSIIDMIFHYYSTTSLLHARITPLHLYKHQWNEDFDIFMTRTEQIIASTNIPPLNKDQLSILVHVDMMSNRYLIKEVHKDFKNIFSMTY